MALMTHLLLLFAAAIPFVAAGPSSCNNDEFWYEAKGTCLPDGGPSWSPSPPTGKQCPPSGWSWSEDHGCCVPHYPHPPSSPHPQCSGGWTWSPDQSCCQQPPPHPKPSGSYDNKRKRTMPQPLSNRFCPMHMQACPIPGATGLTGEFECLDTMNELESCGGCASIGEGQDCSAIKGAWNVGCEQGRCAVYTCTAGYRRARGGKSCIAL